MMHSLRKLLSVFGRIKTSNIQLPKWLRPERRNFVLVEKPQYFSAAAFEIYRLSPQILTWKKGILPQETAGSAFSLQPSPWGMPLHEPFDSGAFCRTTPTWPCSYRSHRQFFY